MSPRLRAAAIEIAERRAENASALYEAAWLTIVRPTGQPEDYRLAVRRLEAACQVVTEDPVRLADYRRALALALDRAGQPAQALETIKSLGHPSGTARRWTWPSPPWPAPGSARTREARTLSTNSANSSRPTAMSTTRKRSASSMRPKPWWIKVRS